MEILKIGPFFIQNRSRGGKTQFRHDGVERGTLDNDQTLCPNLAILEIRLDLENRCPLSHNKLNFDPIREEKEYIWNC